MKLTKTDVRFLIRALSDAIDYEESFIDCHRVEWSNRRGPDGHYIKVIPKEHRALCAQRERWIKKWQQLIEKLRKGHL